MGRQNTRAASYLFRRGAVYTYRRRIPKDVQADPAFGGKEHHHESTGSADRTTAREEELRITGWFDAAVRRARGLPPVKLAPERVSSTVVTRDDLDALYARAIDRFAIVDQEERIRVHADEALAEALEVRDHHAHITVASFNDPNNGSAARRRYIETVVFREIDPFVDHECRKRGITDPTQRLMIRETLADAEIEMLRLRFVRAAGSPFETIANDKAQRGRTIQADRPPEASWTIQKLAEAVLATKPDGTDWRNKVDYTIKLFSAHLGRPKAISDVTYQDVRSFIDQLLLAPANLSQRFPDLGLKEAIEANGRRAVPYPKLNPNTVRDGYFAVLRSLFRHAHKQMRVITTNPTDGLEVRGSSKVAGTRGPFIMSELNNLFREPVFAGSRSLKFPNMAGSLKLNNERFWTPLIMLFSGARPSEIAQLNVTDVKLDASTPYISILTEFDPNDPLDREHVVANKTENARRDIPLHPQLIELGFDKYVRAMKETGERRLFPDWKLSKSRRKAYTQASWIRQMNGTVIPKVSSRHPRPTIYSLRHTFKSQMVECDVPLQLQNQMLGHAKIGMDKNYLPHGVSLKKLYDAVAKVTYPDLELHHLVR
jgi:integrase